MQQLFGTWGPELIALAKQNPLKALAFGINAVSIVLMLMYGKFSGLTGGNDHSGFNFGDGDGDGGSGD
jgi:hypothetical protein